MYLVSCPNASAEAASAEAVVRTLIEADVRLTHLGPSRECVRLVEGLRQAKLATGDGFYRTTVHLDLAPRDVGPPPRGWLEPFGLDESRLDGEAPVEGETDQQFTDRVTRWVDRHLAQPYSGGGSGFPIAVVASPHTLTRMMGVSFPVDQPSVTHLTPRPLEQGW